MITAASVERSSNITGRERITGLVGQSSVELLAQGTPDHVDVAGRIGDQRMALTIHQHHPGARHIEGRVGQQLVDLDEKRTDNRTVITGTCGGRPVELTALRWERGPIRVSGHIGPDTASCFQYPQWDGNIMNGSIGFSNLSLTETQVEGRIPDLEPVDYLIASAAVKQPSLPLYCLP